MTHHALRVAYVDELSVTDAGDVLNKNERPVDIFYSDIFWLCHTLLAPNLFRALCLDALEVSVQTLAQARDAVCIIRVKLAKVPHDRMTIDGDTWTFGGICALAHDALTGKEG